jgi:hypothetical protein
MMSRTFMLSLFAASALVSASPLEARTGGGGGVNQCNTGTAYCCNNSIDGTYSILDFLGNVIAGAQCNTFLLAQGQTCNQTPSCCTNNYQGPALINVQCVTINL